MKAIMFHSDFVFFIPLSFIYIWRLRNKWFLRLNFYNMQCCLGFFHFEFYHILKRHGDPQTHDLDISIEFFHDYHIFYISYKNVVLLTNIIKRWAIYKYWVSLTLHSHASAWECMYYSVVYIMSVRPLRETWCLRELYIYWNV